MSSAAAKRDVRGNILSSSAEDEENTMFVCCANRACFTGEGCCAPSNKQSQGLTTGTYFLNSKRSLRYDSSTDSNSYSKELQAADREIAQVMHSMSLDERQKAYEDIHGVASVMPESPQFLQERLDQMDKHLKDIPASSKKTQQQLNTKDGPSSPPTGLLDRQYFDRVAFLRPSYANAMQLACLRSESYHPHAAAQRLIRHFQAKAYLFGNDNEILARNVHWTDLTADDQATVLCGAHQFVKDRSGRDVLCIFNKILTYTTPFSNSRALWYLWMTRWMDTDALRRGYVCVLSLATQGASQSLMDFRLRQEAVILGQGIPARNTAIHFCYDDPRWTMALKGMELVIQRAGQVRFRSHFGSSMEVHYQLLSFGIPRHVWPVDANGVVQTQAFSLYLHNQQQHEAVEKEDLKWDECGNPIVVCPNSHDILSGVGRPFREYPGNQQLVRLVEEHHDLYQSKSTKGDKKLVVDQIMKEISQRGGRFLKRAEIGTEWLFLEESQARTKVAQCFRNLKHSQKTKLAQPSAGV